MDHTGTHFLLRGMSAFGLVAIIGLAWLGSENRRRVPWRCLAWGVGLQFFFAFCILRTPLGRTFFEQVKAGFDLLTDSSVAGAQFVFGTLPVNHEIGAAVAFQVLPVVIFVSALARILYHFGIIQLTVNGFAWTMRRTLKTSGAETFGVAILVFTGIESMTALRAYLTSMTRSELCTVMTAFMATIAGSVMVAYASFGAAPGHLLAASLMSAPASILIAKLLVPETQVPETQSGGRIHVASDAHNVIDAAARGAGEGLQLALNIGAMLIAFVGAVFLLNKVASATIGYSFTEMMGWVFRPFAFLMGISWRDSGAVGQLLGTKSVLNEFIAYSDMKAMIAAGRLSPRSITIATYALCGFANPGSLAILIAGMSGLIPERRQEVVQLGLKSLIGGTLACFSTACIAGMLLNE